MRLRLPLLVALLFVLPLASQAGVGERTIRNAESGHRVQLDFLSYLAAALSAEVFDLACAALHVVDDHPRARDARLLHGAIEGGRALLQRDGSTGIPTTSPTRRVGVELLICVLAHLATPALPIPGIDRVSWDDPAPFV